MTTSTNQVSLLEISPHTSFKILHIEGGREVRKKLLALNLREGKVIQKIAAQPLAGPIIVQVDNTQCALGRGLAMKIYGEIMKEK